MQQWCPVYYVQSKVSITHTQNATLCVMQTWDVDFLESWIKQHAADAAAMGKPFMIEEFGKEVHVENGAKANITSIRGPFYRKVYQQLQESLANDGALKGAQRCKPVAVCCLLSAVSCLLSAVCCLLSAVCCLLSVCMACQLSAVCVWLWLSAVCCLLSAVCCLLSPVCCLLSPVTVYS